MTQPGTQLAERTPTDPAEGVPLLPAEAGTTGAETIEVRRNAVVAAALGVVSSALAIAYLARAVPGGDPLDWTLAAGMGVLGLGWLVSLVDARTPLLVADAHGLRIRLGSAWSGLPWESLQRVEHRPRRGLARDGRLVPSVREPEVALAALDRRGRRQTRWAGRLYGGPFAVPLGLATRVSVPRSALTATLDRLADGRTEIVEPAPGPGRDRRWRDPRPVLAATIGSLSGGARTRAADDEASTGSQPPAPAPPPPLPDPEPGPAPAAPATADAPVVGPHLAAARTRLRLTVDQLAERTRIRPHVIESIEIDDFGPCGGDFYARGHLRTLARVLGVDVEPLLATYDARYAHAPIDPRRVFEAELATGAHGPIRGTRTGPNWSVLVAAVMAVVLAWSVARLIMDTPVELPQQMPVLDGSGGVDNGSALVGDPVPVSVTASSGVRVVIRDGTGEIVFTGDLAIGESKAVEVAPPVRMTVSDGAAVRVAVAGKEEGRLGEEGRPASRTFIVE